MAVLLKYYNVIAICCGLGLVRHFVFFISPFFLRVEAEKGRVQVPRGYILGVREGFRLMVVHENMKCRR